MDLIFDAVKEALDAAAENDLIQREIAAENEFLKGQDSDEERIVPDFGFKKL